MGSATNGHPVRRQTSSAAGGRQAALYSRVSTSDQDPENQLGPLRSYANARGWTVTEFVDHGVSGSKDRRPALDAMMAAVRGRRVDVVVLTKLDRLARSTHHLVTLAKELEALGVDLVVIEQAIDTTTPAAGFSSTCWPPSRSSSAT